MTRLLPRGTTALALLAGSGPARAAPASTWLDGVWGTDGYGMVVSIGQGHAQVYETTAISCLPAEQVDQVGPVGRGQGRAVRRRRCGTGDDTAGRAGPGAAAFAATSGDITLKRVPALPARCSRPTPTDPVTSFARYTLTTGKLLSKTQAVEHVDAPAWLIDQLRARRRGERVTSPRVRTALTAWRDARHTITRTHASCP